MEDRCVFEVCRFWEKPSHRAASRLMRCGCLWNSFVMVGHVSTFLDLIRRSLPSLSRGLNAMWRNVTPGREEEAWADLYASIPPSSFSDQVLATNARALSVLRASDLGWTDLGEPERVLDLITTKPGASQRWLTRTLQIPAY